MSTEGIVDDPSQIMAATILVCFLQAAALSYPIMTSEIGGWRLIALLVLVFFGMGTFLVQIETLVFLNYFTDIINPQLIPGLFGQGAIASILFVPVAVLIHGRMRARDSSSKQLFSLNMSWTQALAKILGLVTVFVIFYVFFGIFVAWQNPNMGEYYGDLIASMAEVGGLILLLQAGRGLLFIILSLPIIRIMDTATWKKALAIGFLICMLTAANLLIPTSIMPESIRMSHFIEVAVPSFLFGALTVWLLNRRHESMQDLIGREKVSEVIPSAPIAPEAILA